MNIETYYHNEMENFAAIHDFPWHEQEFYNNWLAQTYYYISHSTRLLALASSRFPLNNNKAHNRCLNHAREEKGHEKLAAQDLKNMGYDISDFQETPQLSAFYQAQYYWIEHVSAASFFGYVLALEGLAVNHGRKWHEQILSGGDHVSAKFLEVHVDEDEDHIVKALEAANLCSIEEKQHIVRNMTNSVQLYINFVASCRSNQRANRGLQINRAATL